MSKDNKAIASVVNVEVMKGAHFEKCLCCGSRDLVKFDVDYFCMGCDWNSVLYDVYSGNFEKRIALMAQNRPGRTNRSNGSGVIHLKDLISSKNECSVQKQNISSSEIKPFSKAGGDK